MNKNKVLTFEEFCDYLHVGKNSGYKLLSSGTVNASKVGGKWIIKKKDVNRFLENNKKK